jgi:tetratricopeptide (TPR) repeat protein
MGRLAKFLVFGAIWMSCTLTACASLIKSGWQKDEAAEPPPVEAVAADQAEQQRHGQQVQAVKAKTENIIQRSPHFRVREFLRLGDEALLGVLLGGYDYRGQDKPAAREIVLIETLQKDQPGTFVCPIMSGARYRGGKMEWCRAHNLYAWYNQGTEVTVAEAKKFYNQALDMDPNSVQALTGLGNLYLIQAIAAHYERERLRLELEDLLIAYLAKGEVRTNPLDLALDDLLGKARLGKDPKEDGRLAFQQLLWKAANLRNQITYFVRTARARFEDALRVNGQFPSAHLGLAISAAVAMDWKAAFATLAFIEQNNLQIPRKRSMFYVWKGFVLEQMGDVDEAIQAYSKAVELDEPYQFMEFPRGRLQMILLSRKPK